MVLNNKTLVVLPYKGSGSQGNEIRIALKGWRKFCTFDYHFIVIGTFNESLIDEFPWVEFIKSPQLEKVPDQYNQHLDVQYCMEQVMNKYSNEYNGFIWMVDDNYAIKPFVLEDITTVHYHASDFNGLKTKPASFWLHDKWKTRQILDLLKLPHRNYTTHYPCYFEFDKLKEIWDKFDMRHYSFVLEDIYFNYFAHPEPILDSTIRLGVWNARIEYNELDKAINDPNIKFVCNSVDGWSNTLESKLLEIVK